MKEHIHKYLRVIKKANGYTVFKCTIPGCTHWQRKELLLGNHAICWVCGLEMTLTKESLERKKPIHFECRRERKLNAA